MIQAAYRGHAVRLPLRQRAAEASHCAQEKADVGVLDDMLENLDVEESDFVADHLDLLKLEAQTIRAVACGSRLQPLPVKAPHKVLQGRRRAPPPHPDLPKPPPSPTAPGGALHAMYGEAHEAAREMAPRRWEGSATVVKTAGSRIPEETLIALRARLAVEVLLPDHRLRAIEAGTLAAFLGRSRPGTLEVLELGANPLIGHAGLAKLAASLPGTALRRLGLGGCVACGLSTVDADRGSALWMHDPSAVQELADVLAESSLEELDLSDNALARPAAAGADGAARDFSALTALINAFDFPNQLVELNLSNNTLSFDGAAVVAGVFGRKFCRLASLDLGHTACTQSSAGALVRGIAASECDVTGVQELCAALAGGRAATLRRLSLAGSRLGGLQCGGVGGIEGPGGALVGRAKEAGPCRRDRSIVEGLAEAVVACKLAGGALVALDVTDTGLGPEEEAVLAMQLLHGPLVELAVTGPQGDRPGLSGHATPKDLAVSYLDQLAAEDPRTNGGCALHWVCSRSLVAGDDEPLQLGCDWVAELLERNPDHASVFDADGATPLDLARKADNDAYIRLLETVIERQCGLRDGRYILTATGSLPPYASVAEVAGVWPAADVRTGLTVWLTVFEATAAGAAAAGACCANLSASRTVVIDNFVERAVAAAAEFVAPTGRDGSNQRVGNLVEAFEQPVPKRGPGSVARCVVTEAEETSARQLMAAKAGTNVVAELAEQQRAATGGAAAAGTTLGQLRGPTAVGLGLDVRVAGQVGVVRSLARLFCPLPTVAKLAADTLAALRWLHDGCSLAHTDVRAETVGRFADGWRLTGSLRHATRFHRQLTSLPGPANCAAPEVAAAAAGLGPVVAAGRAVDMWGLGVLLLELLTARPLFDPDSCELAAVAQLSQEAVDRRLAAIPAEPADMLRLLLAVNPAERPTAEQLLGKGGGRLHPHRFLWPVVRGRGMPLNRGWMGMDSH